MALEKLTWESLLTTGLVVVLIVTVYNTISTALKNRREQQKTSPLAQAVERIDAHDTMLAADKRRIENLEETTASLKERNAHMDEGIMILMRSTLAMSRHMQHGNNLNGLRESENETMDYLTNKQ